MPTANVYYSDWCATARLPHIAPKFKDYIAHKLTCGDIKLRQNEVTVRFIKVNPIPTVEVKGIGFVDDMLGDLEVDITAHAFPDRIRDKDKICADVKKWLRKEAKVKNPRVWLRLCELGHDARPKRACRL